MDKSCINALFTSHRACPRCPSPEEISDFFTKVLGLLFPDFSKVTFESVDDLGQYMKKLSYELQELLEGNPEKGTGASRQLAEEFFNTLPVVLEKLNKDISAMYKGDPAARSRSEIVRTYPGFYAITAYRIAHELYRLGVRGIPRIITEHAHSKTGIDINPGATIGEYFCIDHGTGIVIGETSVIGNNVKIYQGVTLGALSVNKEDAEKKRHPTIEDNVVIYSGATILGGETVIGRNSIVGGNVWITKSVEPDSKIYYQARMHNDGKDETDMVVFR